MVKKRTILPFLLIMNMAGCSDNALNMSTAELCKKAKNNPESLIADMSALDARGRDEIDRILKGCKKS